MSVGHRAGWVLGRERLTLLFQGEMVRPSMYNCLTLIKGVLRGEGGVDQWGPGVLSQEGAWKEEEEEEGGG